MKVTKMFIKNKEIMNKSAVFRLKLSFPNVSGLALHQWNYQFVETVAVELVIPLMKGQARNIWKG